MIAKKGLIMIGGCTLVVSAITAISFKQEEQKVNAPMITACQAHPGRTDGSGCHTCRTNCEKWGLSYGEYHCHNGGGSSSGSQATTPAYDAQDEQARIAEQQRLAEEARIAEQKRQEEEAKHQEELRLAEEKRIQEQKEYDQGYQEGFDYKWKNIHDDLSIEQLKEDQKSAKYQEGYEKGFAEAQKQLNEEKEKAYQLGYDQKKNDPNLSFQEPADQSENYKKAFRSGYDTAEKELTAFTQKVAKEHASHDGIHLDHLDENFPDGVIHATYTQAYQTAYQEAEADYFEKIANEARQNAQEKVWNQDQQSDPQSKQAISEKGKAKYQTQFAASVQEIEKNLKAEKASIQEQGYQDGLEGKEKEDTTFSKYKKYKIYNDLQSAYLQGYRKGEEKKQEEDNMFFAGTLSVLLTTIGGGGLIAYKKHKQKTM